MPSLHTAFALFVPAFFLPMIRPKWLKALVLLFPVAMITSLVYFGEHWVIDGSSAPWSSVCRSSSGTASNAVSVGPVPSRPASTSPSRLGPDPRPARHPGDDMTPPSILLDESFLIALLDRDHMSQRCRTPALRGAARPVRAPRAAAPCPPRSPRPPRLATPTDDPGPRRTSPRRRPAPPGREASRPAVRSRARRRRDAGDHETRANRSSGVVPPDLRDARRDPAPLIRQRSPRRPTGHPVVIGVRRTPRHRRAAALR